MIISSKSYKLREILDFLENLSSKHDSPSTLMKGLDVLAISIRSQHYLGDVFMEMKTENNAIIKYNYVMSDLRYDFIKTTYDITLDSCFEKDEGIKEITTKCQ